MILSRVELVRCLSRTLDGLGNEEGLMSCFMFTGKKVYTFNNRVGVSIELPEGVMLDGIVHANELMNTLKHFDDDELKISNHKNQWVIECGTASMTVNLIDGNVTDIISAITPKGKWTELDEDFIEIVRLCHINKNSHKNAGLYINEDFLAEFNNTEMHSARLSKLMPVMFIDNFCTEKLMKHCPFEVCTSKAFAFFKCKDSDCECILALRRLSEKEYDYEKVMTVSRNSIPKGDEHGIMIPNGMDKIVSRAEIFSSKNGEKSVIKLSFNDGNVVVSSRKAHGSYEEKVSVCGNANGIEFYVSSELLKDIIRMTDKVSISGNGKNYRLLYSCGKTRHIVCTYNVEEIE